MWPGRVSKDQLFYATILTALAISVFCNRSVNACYEYQYCLTPLNYSGRYMEDETYGDMTDKAKMLCDGFCHHNSTLRLRCCAYDATVKLERISEQVCTYNHLIRGFVIHGEIAKDNEFPFMAALGWRIKNETTGNTTIVYKCGGTIYDRGYVITAAHCLYHSSELPVVVRPGGFALNDTDAWDLEIEEIIEHPNYEYPNVYNDIAIIRLKTIFYGNPFHDQPACLYDDPSSAHNVTAIGYGNTQFALNSHIQVLFSLAISQLEKLVKMPRLRNYSKPTIFGIINWLILVVHIFSPVDACYNSQECYTPQNYKGYYYTPEEFLTLTDRQKSNCEGNCVDNNVTLICCTFNTQPQKYRLLYQSCLDAHLPYGFITFGEVAKLNEFPFMAALGWRFTKEDGTESIAYRCGGTLISSRYLLTAAHCFYHSSDLPVVVRPGGFDLNSTTATDYDIDQIIEHPNYIYPGLYNDIAIVRMAKAYINYTPIVARACVWYSPLAEQEVTAIGYGNTQFAGTSSPLLLKTSLSTISNEECNQHYEQDDKVLSSGVISTQLCAKDYEKLRDTCQGDSGGPLIVYEKIDGYSRMAYIVGITSFGIGCGTGFPGIYTRISDYFDWIEETIFK